MPNGLGLYVSKDRSEIQISDKPQRKVHESEICKGINNVSLGYFVADHAPFFYREPKVVSESVVTDRAFLTMINETLIRLPTSPSFQESHFGEILASLFFEDVLGFKRIYSKLSLLTAENANAFKMDVVGYVPKSDPVQFIFCEVKTSMKHSGDGMPPKHDGSCYPSLFTSVRSYSEDDLKFDLSAIKDRVYLLPSEDRERVREALKPYSQRSVSYIGFAIIDKSTKLDEETKVLLERKCATTFSGELVCVEDLRENVKTTFETLLRMKKDVQPG